MYKIYFFKDRKGRQQALEYIIKLQRNKDKDSRIKANKINDYFQALSIYGTQLGQPYVKHIWGDIWEIRPIKDRFFFVAWQGDSFVVLHQFTKKTQKTPQREIDKAKSEYLELQERGMDNEEE